MGYQTSETVTNSQVGWSPDRWFQDIGISRSTGWKMMKDGVLPFIHIGKRRIIPISPADYIAKRLRERDATRNHGTSGE